MNKNSNSYIIIYTVVMVIVVAVILSVVSLSLKGRQEQNVLVERRIDILRSIGKALNEGKAKDKVAYIEAEYRKYIVDSYVVNASGDTVAGADAFSVLRNIKAEYDKPAAQRELPVFVAAVDSSRRYILPVWGKGLWGPLWGYVALESDWTTIAGVVLDHSSETPGLGAEIADAEFQARFDGKSIFDGEKFVSITLLKGKGSSAGNPHAVDAISGGTITCRGVEAMFKNSLSGYLAHIEKIKSYELRIASEQTDSTTVTSVVDSTIVVAPQHTLRRAPAPASDSSATAETPEASQVQEPSNTDN